MDKVDLKLLATTLESSHDVIPRFINEPALGPIETMLCEDQHETPQAPFRSTVEFSEQPSIKTRRSEQLTFSRSLSLESRRSTERDESRNGFTGIVHIAYEDPNSIVSHVIVKSFRGCPRIHFCLTLSIVVSSSIGTFRNRYNHFHSYIFVPLVALISTC